MGVLGCDMTYSELGLLTKCFFLSIAIFSRRDMEGLFKRRAEAVVGFKSDFGSNLVDGVVRFFQELFGFLEA